MVKKTEPDWEKAYEVFDGAMPACLGKGCTASCCTLKTAKTWGHGLKKYSTTLDQSEFSFQLSRFGAFPPEIETELADTHLISKARYLVRGCLAPDGTCRLKDRKPMQCRVFPFSPLTHIPLETSCPVAKFIAGDVQVRTKIISVREFLGFNDSEEWNAALIRILEEDDSF